MKLDLTYERLNISEEMLLRRLVQRGGGYPRMGCTDYERGIGDRLVERGLIVREKWLNPLKKRRAKYVAYVITKAGLAALNRHMQKAA